MRGRRAIVAVLALSPAVATASPYRLRADAFTQVQEPLGVLALEGEGEVVKGLSVSALLWGAAGGEPNPEADALVALVSYRDPDGYTWARAGRWVLTSGALPPVHLDGIAILGRAPWGGTAEAFAGMPVVPRFGPRAFDWVAGGRLAQSFGPATFGLAYLHRRDAGQLADHELALDALLLPIDGFDLAVRASADLIHLGVSQATIAGAYERGAWRVELQGAQRSPSRLLPATSLFSVLGDAALRQAFGRVRWRAAPRLDLSAAGGVRLFDDEPAEDVILSALLRLGADGGGAVGLDLTRQGGPDEGWIGARATGRVPLVLDLAVLAEVEVVVPDEPRDRGELWPWALLGLSWAPAHWELAAAFEASAGPSAESSFDVLLRVAYHWSGR